MILILLVFAPAFLLKAMAKRLRRRRCICNGWFCFSTWAVVMRHLSGRATDVKMVSLQVAAEAGKHSRQKHENIVVIDAQT
jgi:hypothetical protein